MTSLFDFEVELVQRDLNKDGHYRWYGTGERDDTFLAQTVGVLKAANTVQGDIKFVQRPTPYIIVLEFHDGFLQGHSWFNPLSAAKEFTLIGRSLDHALDLADTFIALLFSRNNCIRLTPVLVNRLIGLGVVHTINQFNAYAREIFSRGTFGSTKFVQGEPVVPARELEMVMVQRDYLKRALDCASEIIDELKQGSAEYTDPAEEIARLKDELAGAKINAMAAVSKAKKNATSAEKKRMKGEFHAVTGLKYDEFLERFRQPARTGQSLEID